VDDAVEGVILRQAGHADFQRARAVDRAGEDVVAGRLVNRHALPGDRSLVDGRAAAENDAVHRDALAGGDQDRVADRQIADRHARFVHAAERAGAAGIAILAHVLGAVNARALDDGRLRDQVEQTAEGVAGAIGGVALQCLADGEQDDDRRCLARLADQDRADGGDAHQQIDRDFPAEAQLTPGVDHDRQAGQGNDRQVQAADQHLRSAQQAERGAEQQ